MVIRSLWRGRDIGICYAAIVTIVAVALAVVPAWSLDRVIAATSTNLVNLRHRPIFVLALSAFVLPSLTALVQVPLLVWLYGLVQRWLGRAATIVTAAYGHVGATLFVAVLLATGITRGAVSPSVRTAPDVGVSYGLLTLAGLCTARLRGRARAIYALVGTAALVSVTVITQTFSDVGHLVAWLIGLGLVTLAGRRPAEAP
jgi:hypothetical protein